MVVFGHVSLFGFSYQNNVIADVIAIVNMPLFFFLSGFVAFKSAAEASWTGRYVFSRIVRKAGLLFVPFMVFFSINLYLSGTTLEAGLAGPMKQGYWFLPVLFYMFFVYYLLLWTTNNNMLCKFRDAFLVGAAVGILGAGFMLKNGAGACDYLSGFLFCRYFHFFVFGVLARKYSRYFYKLFDPIPVAVILLLFFGLLLLFGNQISGVQVSQTTAASAGLVGMIPVILKYVPVPYLGLLVAFGFFYRYRNLFGDDKPIGRAMRYMGRRTLDIYLIHYFWIPALPFIGVWLAEYPNDLLFLLSAVLLSILVAGASLLIGNMLRMSNFLAHWLFGQKLAV